MSSLVVNEELGDQDDVLDSEWSAVEGLVFRLVLNELEELTADVSLDLVVMMDVEGGTSDVRYLQHADFVELVPEDIGVQELPVSHVIVEAVKLEQPVKKLFSMARVIEQAIIDGVRRLITLEAAAEEVSKFSKEDGELVSIEPESDRRDVRRDVVLVVGPDSVIEVLIVDNDSLKLDVVHFGSSFLLV